MRAALLIARHDLRRQLRNRTAIVTGFVAPLAMAAIVGLAFGHSSSGFLRVVIADQDHTVASAAAIQTLIDNAGFGTIVVLDKVPDEAAARSQFNRGIAGAAVVIRPGYGDVLAGRQSARAQVDAITSRHRPYAEQVARSVVRGLYGEISANVLAVRTAIGNGAVAPDQFAALTTSMRTQPAPVKITEEGIPATKGLLGYFGPSMAIVFLFLGIGAGARSFLGERDTGTLARLKAAPIGLGKVVGGKVAAVLALAFRSSMP